MEKLDIKKAEEPKTKDREEKESLMLGIDPGLQDILIERVLFDVKQDETDHAGYIEKVVKNIKMYEGEKEPKNDPFVGCYSEDTEVLTNGGWKLVKDVSTKDKVYSLNPKNGEAGYYSVTDTQENYYKTLLQFKSNSVDLLVSPDHNMAIHNDENSQEIKLIKAEKLFNHRGHKRIPLISKYKSKKRVVKIYGFNAEDWMEFLGWYISEGCANSYKTKKNLIKSGSIFISQSSKKNPENCKRIKNLLKRMGVDYSYSCGRTFVLSVKRFPAKARKELVSLGKIHQKFIPRKYLDLPISLLEILLESLVYGDGCKHADTSNKNYKDKISYYTASKKLADDVQELVQKIGKRAKITIREPREKGWLRGYTISILWRHQSKVSKFKYAKVNYENNAYCLTTPHHTLYVRRNGTACWCGNCANIKTMILAMVVELLHSKLFPVCWNENLTYWIPQERADISTAENISLFMKWVIRAIRFGSFVDDFIKTLILEETVVSKIRWEEKWEWVQRKILKENATTKLKRVILNLFGIPQETWIKESDYKVEYEYVKKEYAVTEILPLEDVGFPTFSVPGSDENKLRHIWHRTRPILSELKENSYINIDKLEQLFGNKLVKEGKIQKAKMEAEQTIESNVITENSPVELIEWYGKIPEFGYECIVWVEKSCRVFLGAMPLVKVSKIERRPFTVTQFIRRTNRMFGTGPVSLARELQDEIDGIHNQRMDAGTMAIIPPGFYRAASGITPEEIRIKPGIWIPLDDITDAKWVTIPNNVLVSFQEERMIMELIEKLTSVGSYQSGQESDINRSRSTARGTLAIIAQGEQRYSVLGKRVQDGIAKILGKVLQLYQQNIPPGLGERILGETGENIFPEGLTPEGISGNYDVHLSLDATAGSKDMQRQISTFISDFLINSPFGAQNPAGLWEAAADVFRSVDKVDVEKYLGPKPPQNETEMPESVRKEISLIKQGQISDEEVNPMPILVGLMQYKQTPEGTNLLPEHKALLEKRIADLKAKLFLGLTGGKDAGQQVNRGGAGGPVLERPNPAPAGPGASPASQEVRGGSPGGPIQ